MTKRRIMGDAYFTTEAEAETFGAKLREAGFGFKITADPYTNPPPGHLDFSDGPFAVVWRDEENPTGSEDESMEKFGADVGEAVGAGTVDNVGVVAPDFLPDRLYPNK